MEADLFNMIPHPGAPIKKVYDYSKSHHTSIEVSEVIKRPSEWVEIVDTDSIPYHYKMNSKDDCPKPFSFVKLYWGWHKTGSRYDRRRIVKKFEILKEDLAVDER